MNREQAAMKLEHIRQYILEHQPTEVRFPLIDGEAWVAMKVKDIDTKARKKEKDWDELVASGYIQDFEDQILEAFGETMPQYCGHCSKECRPNVEHVCPFCGSALQGDRDPLIQ